MGNEDRSGWLLSRLRTTADVCRLYPDKLEKLVNALDPGIPLLAKAIGQWQGGGHEEACRTLLQYYIQSDHSLERALRLGMGEGTELSSSESAGDYSGLSVVSEANALLEDRFDIYGECLQVPRNADGFLDWHTKGITGDYNWGLIFNRHTFLDTLYRAYTLTGEERYAMAYDRFVRDWIMANPWIMRRSYEDAEWNERPWRSLEAALRIAVWARGFYGFQHVPAFTDAGRLLQLISVQEHAEHILHYSAWPKHEYPNIYATEMTGLAQLAHYWPEFKDSRSWLDTALAAFSVMIADQVYPDGAHKELTSTYHHVAVREFDHIAELANGLGRPFAPEYQQYVESMWAYLAFVIKPDGCNPLNADSDVTNMSAVLLGAAGRHKRDDWLYIASGGKAGMKPSGLPSKMFPWAGQLAMRNGWELNQEDAQWAFFDGGPFGSSGHGHRDKLHISIYAFGRDLLVDSGRYIYNQDKWLMDYFRESSASHNVIMPDGFSQCEGERIAQSPLTGFALTDEADYIKSTFTGGYYAPGEDSMIPTIDATHTRSLVYIRNQFWIVVDRMEMDKPRKLEALWHFHPDCTLRAEREEVASVDKDLGNLRIVPLLGTRWQPEIINGMEHPRIQGWYSEHYGAKKASSCVVYTSEPTEEGLAAWILFPGRGDITSPVLEIHERSQHKLHFSMQSEYSDFVEFVIHMNGKSPVLMKDGNTYEADCVLLHKDGHSVQLTAE